MRFLVLSVVVSCMFAVPGKAQAPTFEIARAASWIKFDVKSSTKIAGKFDMWDATLRFASADETTGALDVEIQAASVDTGSGLKNRKLKSKDFFDVDQNPLISFKSTRFVSTATPGTYEVDGDFTIRGTSNPEKLTLKVSHTPTGSSEITGAMVFNRRDYGMNKGIPFIKIADHVDVNFHLVEKHVGGPALASDAKLGRREMPRFPSTRITAVANRISRNNGAYLRSLQLTHVAWVVPCYAEAFDVITDKLLPLAHASDSRDELFSCAGLCGRIQWRRDASFPARCRDQTRE